MVGIDEILDPSDHPSDSFAIAFWVARSRFHVDHSRERYAISCPASAVREEESGLGASGPDIWTSEMVATANEARLCCTDVVAREVRIDEGSSFRRLDISTDLKVLNALP
jgi:hypothetical protein